MKAEERTPIRVMRIIARMNVGGPAVQVSGLMRGIDKQNFDQRLYTGVCSENEADYLQEVATDIESYKIAGLGRSCLLYTSPSPRDRTRSRMPSSA